MFEFFTEILTIFGYVLCVPIAIVLGSILSILVIVLTAMGLGSLFDKCL